jgi:hypothetical protein
MENASVLIKSTPFGDVLSDLCSLTVCGTILIVFF